MRPGGSKAKGSAFERTICKDLSLWLSKGKRDDLLWRSAMSGGRATIGGLSGKNRAAQAGDISGIAEPGVSFANEFYIECKFLRDLQLDRFVLENKGVLAAIWRQVETNAKAANKHPMLIAKQNRLPVIIVVDDSSHSRSLSEVPGMEGFPAVVFGSISNHLSIYLLDSFLSGFVFRMRGR